MESIKNGAQYIGEKIQETASGTKKEANKEVAKDNNATASTRLTAAKDAYVDKKDEVCHKTHADVHKEAAKH